MAFHSGVTVSSCTSPTINCRRAKGRLRALHKLETWCGVACGPRSLVVLVVLVDDGLALQLAAVHALETGGKMMRGTGGEARRQCRSLRRATHLGRRFRLHLAGFDCVLEPFFLEW